MSGNIRRYDVRIRDLQTGEERTVKARATTSLDAARAVYAGFGGKGKIKVLSSEKQMGAADE